MIFRIMLASFAIFSVALNLSGENNKLSKETLYFGIADGNYLMGDLKGADRTLNEILKFSPQFAPALSLKARILLEQKDTQNALHFVERAISSEPESTKHKFLKALILINLNKKNEALSLIKSVRENEEPKSEDYQIATDLLDFINIAPSKQDTAYFNNNYLSKPDKDNTNLKTTNDKQIRKVDSGLKNNHALDHINSLSEALRINEADDGEIALEHRFELRMLRALAYARNGAPEKAIKDLQVLNAQNSTNTEVILTLASLYATTGRWQSLEGVLEPLKNKKNLADIVSYLEGRIALAKNRVGTARNHFEVAMKQIPDGPSNLRPNVHFYQSVCFERLKRINEATHELQSALDQGFKPETSDEAIFTGKLLLRMKQPKTAIPLLEALTLNEINSSPEVWSLLGRAHLLLGSKSIAISAFNESLRLNSAQTDTRALRGELLREIGDLNGAATDLELARKEDPNNTALYYSLGLTRFQQQRFKDASKSLSKALVNNLASNEGALLLSALSDYAIGDLPKAKKTLSSYFKTYEKTPASTAIYLKYILTAKDNPLAALNNLKILAAKPMMPAEIGYFYGYCAGILDKKAFLDLLGTDSTPEVALKNIAAGSFWMAQHQGLKGNRSEFISLLNQAAKVGNIDQPEVILSRWQLNKSRNEFNLKD